MIFAENLEKGTVTFNNSHHKVVGCGLAYQVVSLVY